MKKYLFATLLFVGACGGGGPSDSTKLTDLTAADEKELCLDSVSEFPKRSVTCTVGMQSITIEIGLDEAECNSPSDPVMATCTATVGDVRACYRAISDFTDAQLCDEATPDPAACAKLDGCY